MLPKSRLDYWKPKIEANKDRDTRSLADLTALGWSALVVWQCELRELGRVIERVEEFLRDE